MERELNRLEQALDDARERAGKIQSILDAVILLDEAAQDDGWSLEQEAEYSALQRQARDLGIDL